MVYGFCKDKQNPLNMADSKSSRILRGGEMKPIRGRKPLIKSYMLYRLHQFYFLCDWLGCHFGFGPFHVLLIKCSGEGCHFYFLFFFFLYASKLANVQNVYSQSCLSASGAYWWPWRLWCSQMLDVGAYGYLFALSACQPLIYLHAHTCVLTSDDQDHFMLQGCGG